MLGKIASGIKTGLLKGLNGNPQGAQQQISQSEPQIDVSSVESFYFSFMPPKQKSVGDNALGDASAAISKVTGRGPAPRLAPVGSKIGQNDTGSTSDGGPSTHVNIRDDHHWTESPMSSRGEVPYMTLKEYKILSNPMLNQMINNVAVAAEQLTRAAGDLSKAGQVAGEVLKEITGDGFSKESMKRGLKKAGDAVLDGAQNRKAESTEYYDPMAPYNMMYMTEPTKFKYTFPYMENVMRNVSNSMGGETGKAGKILDAVQSGIEFIGQTADDITLRSLREPGIMIENIEAFNLTGRSKSYTVRFPLFNTKDYKEICRNWEFLFLLIYQNQPNRISKDLVNPPCIYEARIPGVWYSKYSYIQNLTVDFVGARREMPIKINFIEQKDSGGAQSAPPPSNNPVDGNTAPQNKGYTETGSSDWQVSKKTLMTVIPDAYQVSLTVSEIFGETQNSMYHMIRESSNSKITVNGN